MDLIIKPTERCNFKCTFCSSTKIADSHVSELEASKVIEFLKANPDTETIIVNGGDPLMMPVEYYWEILSYIDQHRLKTTLSLTTNLWGFYKSPQKWVNLFRHPNVGVCTSFQYGNSRLKGNLEPFTEEEFWRISDIFLALVGYRPTFIAVITEENQDTVIKTVELAKKMNVICKVNYANASGPVKYFKGIAIGNEGKPFLLADIYSKYIEILEAGLAPWEHNAQQMVKAIRNEPTICPISRRCDEGIRSLQPDDRYYSCGAFGDDNLYPVDFKEDMVKRITGTLQNQLELFSMKEDCQTCPMFLLCNGCRKTIHDLKSCGRVEEHCMKMKAQADKIIELSDLHEFD